MNQLHVLDASGRLADAVVGEIERVAPAALEAVTDDLDLDGIDLVICEYPGLAIEELGVGGYAPGAGLVIIAVELDSPNLDNLATWRDALQSTIAHELHHAKRWGGPGYGDRSIHSLVRKVLTRDGNTARETAWMPAEEFIRPDR